MLHVEGSRKKILVIAGVRRYRNTSLFRIFICSIDVALSLLPFFGFFFFVLRKG